MMRLTIWHGDDSVVLQVENTQFRVHWGILALNSSFFREMPQLPDQLSVDGCPVVKLAGDTIIDVEHLLKALYTPTFLVQTSLPFPVVTALIRLGRKYDFKDLLDTAVERLTFENPMTLEDYDALKQPNNSHQTTRILWYPGILFDMLTVARENNILSALPCAYFRAVQFCSSKFLFDGISRGDTTMTSLAPVDQRRCVLGREALIKVQAKEGYTVPWLYAGNGNCSDPAKCKNARALHLQKHVNELSLYALSTSLAFGASLFCVPCQKSYVELLDAGRKRLWEELPKFFELPPWAELTNDLCWNSNRNTNALPPAYQR
ncbi:hypothetical protein K438DRAFT_1844226 [Mycena galopus ATCC 62051]|nr:hypothetical protein K438DRAFT_1844226 [Mycena galopus ATCC 62051]